MEYMTPQKNEDAFRKWDWDRRWLIRGFWILTSLYILAVVVYPLVYPLVYPFVRTLIPTAPGEMPGPQEPWWLPIIVVLGLFYIIILIFIRLCYIPWRLGQLSKDAAVFAAIVAAEDLERGNPVKASLSMDRLLSALSDFLGQKLVPLGAIFVTPRDFMHITPSKIPRRAVFRAVQANEDTKDFQERLGSVAIGLSGKVDADYPAAHQFLIWLNQKAEPYRKGSESFLDERPILKTMLLEVAPVILPFAGEIVIAIL